MEIMKSLAVTVSLLALTSCANLDVLKRKPIQGNNFNAELSRDYLKFADSEAKQYDWIDSNHFAKKGLAAAKNKQVDPEDLSHWNLTPEHKAELTHERAELIASLTNQNKGRFPKEAADAQAFFDCWVEEQEEDWQLDKIVYCKDHYINARNKLHEVIKAAEAPIAEPVVEAPAPEEKIHHRFVVYFDFDKSNIASSEASTLTKALKAQEKLQSAIRLDGFADDTGGEEYNMTLSNKRADAVKDYLTNLGLDGSVFESHGHGKHDLAIKTPTGVKERLNRRVEIVIKDKQ